MPTIHVERTISAPIDAVFEAISDHERYAEFPGIKFAEITREGGSERNGLGALRRIRTFGVTFVEEIVRFERPARMDYVIREVNVPMVHESGTMELEETDAGTKVVWISTYHVTTPVVGGLLGAITARVTTIGFGRLLAGVERRLAREPVAAQPA